MSAKYSPLFTSAEVIAWAKKAHHGGRFLAPAAPDDTDSGYSDGYVLVPVSLIWEPDRALAWHGSRSPLRDGAKPLTADMVAKVCPCHGDTVPARFSGVLTDTGNGKFTSWLITDADSSVMPVPVDLTGLLSWCAKYRRDPRAWVYRVNVKPGAPLLLRPDSMGADPEGPWCCAMPLNVNPHDKGTGKDIIDLARRLVATTAS